MYVSDSGVFPLSWDGCHSPSPNLQRRKWTSWLWVQLVFWLFFLHTIFSIKDSEFTDLDFVHLYVVGSAYCLWCWRCQISQRYWRPRLHLQHLHGWQVCMYLCGSVSHHVLHGRCIFTYQASFPNSLYLSLFQVLQQLRRRLSDWWGKGLRMFSLSSITRTMIAQSPVPILPLDFLFSVSLCLFVSVVPQQGEILITTEFGKMMVEPNEICVIQVRSMFFIPPCFHKDNYYCVCPNILFTIIRKTACGTFQKEP